MTHLIRDWMTPNPITINGDNTLSVAYNLMRINSVRHLPVVNDNEELIGMLSWGDVREARPKASGSKEQNAGWEDHFLAAIRDVSEFMTPIPQTASTSMPIGEAAKLMMEQRISCLPIVDGGGVVGIVTEVDLFRFIVETEMVDKPGTDGGQIMSTSINEPNSALKNSESNVNSEYGWFFEPKLDTANA